MDLNLSGLSIASAFDVERQRDSRDLLDQDRSQLETIQHVAQDFISDPDVQIQPKPERRDQAFPHQSVGLDSEDDRSVEEFVVNDQDTSALTGQFDSTRTWAVKFYNENKMLIIAIAVLILIVVIRQIIKRRRQYV